MSVPAKKLNLTFSEALAVAKPKLSRIQIVAEKLGEVEGKVFMDAMHDPSVSGHAIRDACRVVGVGLSQSTISLYRREHDIV